MATETDPIVGNWYIHLDKGQRYCVVAIDEDSEIVEIQHFDGDLEELSLQDWYEMDVELSEEPDNWAGADDIDEVDDYGTEVTDTDATDWNDPLSDFSSSEKY